MALGRRRDAILAAAGGEFAQCGFAGARIDRIAAAAAVNKQLIFHYFHSKEGLYSAATSALFATWQPVPESAATSPSELLRLVVAHLLRWLRENPGAVRAVAEAWRPADDLEGTAPPEGTVVAWLANAGGELRTVVEGGQRQGYFRDDVDPAVIADIAISSALGHLMAVGSQGATQAETSTRLATSLAQALTKYCSWR